MELAFVDVHCNGLRDRVDIELRHRVLDDERRVTGHDAKQPIAIANLHTEPQGLYQLDVTPECYQPPLTAGPRARLRSIGDRSHPAFCG